MASDSNRDGSSAIEFLKQAIWNRFGIKDIPDGYFFFPVELSGLEVQSQLIVLIADIRRSSWSPQCPAW
jgi:hypothetical protein